MPFTAHLQPFKYSRDLVCCLIEFPLWMNLLFPHLLQQRCRLSVKLEQYTKKAIPLWLAAEWAQPYWDRVSSINSSPQTSLSRKVQFLIESNSSLRLTAVFHPKTFLVQIYCLEEAMLTLLCICQSMTISHSKALLGVPGPSSFLNISLNISTLIAIFVELLKDKIPPPDW